MCRSSVFLSWSYDQEALENIQNRPPRSLRGAILVQVDEWMLSNPVLNKAGDFLFP